MTFEQPPSLPLCQWALARTQEGLVCERIPYLILPVRQLSRELFGSRRSASSEPSSMTPGPSRIEPSGEAQIRRSDMSEPSGKPLRQSPIETIYASCWAHHWAYVELSTEAPRASGRTNRHARLDPNHPLKRCKRAVGHTAETTHICRQTYTEPSAVAIPPREPSGQLPSVQASRRAIPISNRTP